MAGPAAIIAVLVRRGYDEHYARYVVVGNKDIVKRMNARGATAGEIATELIKVEGVGQGDDEPLGQTYAMPEYAWYVIHPEGFIESGWEFAEDAQDRLREIRRASGVGYKMLNLHAIRLRRIDPRDDACWLKAYE